MSSSVMSTPVQTSATRTIALVAKREITVQVRTKSFLVSNAIILVVILSGIIGASMLSGGTDSGPKVGLVGSAASLSGALSASAKASGHPVDASTVADEATARAKVTSGDLEVALVPRGTGSYTAIVDKNVPAELRSVIEAVVRQQAVNSALKAQGVDPATLTQTAARAVVTVNALNPPDPDAGQRTALAVVAVFLMFQQILGFGMAVAMGVVEEKSSRVVEVLLSTIKPLHLLCGKVLGIGALGLGQLFAYGVVGLGAGMATGLLQVSGLAAGVFASVLFWFVLGFAFYAVAYAAAGSMVSRQEDVGSTTTPFTMMIMGSLFLAITSLQGHSGMLAEVLSWIPPFSAMMMPLRIAAGTTSPAQIVGSAVLMLLATAALAVVAARIYQRSVLRTGKRVSWGEALRARS